MLKPSASNAALRYLWARHRIAVLADYNRLSPDDGRIKEVTDLGLNYNLLTAYTSFIAVDSLKRLKEGQATTVKQPLPLPQGVADTAVKSRGIMARNASPSLPLLYAVKPQKSLKSEQRLYSAPPKSVPKDGVVRGGVAPQLSEQEVRTNEDSTIATVEKLVKKSDGIGIMAIDETMDKDESSDTKSAMKARVKIGSITITGNISQADVRKQLEALLEDIGKCYEKSFGNCSQWPQTVFATMVIGSQGVDVNFKVADVKTPVKGFEFDKCMEPLFSKMKLAWSNQKGVVKIIVTFVLQK
jgi:hypothetical protein